ncbi:MAG TPA: hypothetical protein VKC89_03240 [Patescibacteria group bacterium]|nr:hypothetical protein [Patescibacteria group bacterium]
MKNKAILGALSLDLKRAALGLNRGSNQMANRFFEEALKRRDEIDSKTVKPYIARFLKNLEKIKDKEDALLYSTIFQNASQV